MEFECWLFLEDYINSAFFFGGGILYFDLFNFPPSQECLLKLFSEFSSCYICHILNLDTRDLNGFSQTSLWKSVYTFRETASSTDKVPTIFGVTKHALFSIFTLAMSIILAQCLFALAFFGYRRKPVNMIKILHSL